MSWEPLKAHKMTLLKHCQCRDVLPKFTFEALALQVPGGHFLIFFAYPTTLIHYGNHTFNGPRFSFFPNRLAKFGLVIRTLIGKNATPPIDLYDAQQPRCGRHFNRRGVQNPTTTRVAQPPRHKRGCAAGHDKTGGRGTQNIDIST